MFLNRRVEIAKAWIVALVGLGHILEQMGLRGTGGPVASRGRASIYLLLGTPIKARGAESPEAAVA